MITHDLVQGSPEWHAYRANHFNASDAPAMMGVSAYKTRTQLLHERFTGESPEVDAATQRRFDAGHEFEAMARPLAEDIIGMDLYPVVGSLGDLSASFDGLTVDDSIAYEHKTLNSELRTLMSANCTGADLPAMYRVQMEQQLLVSGAERVLFMASRWEGGKPVEVMNCWYESDPVLRQQIIDGWAQFAKDLAAYVPTVVLDKPKAQAIERLPALAVVIRGEVVTSNLPAFREAADKFIAEIKTDLKTDADFADAEATVKFCEKAEKDLEKAKSAAMAQTASIDDLMRTVDHIKAQLRDKRLALDKLVTKRKGEIKDEILQTVREAYFDHIVSLEEETHPVRLDVNPRPNFVDAAKGKRTLDSMQDAVNTELARAKIAADSQAQAIRKKLAWYKQAAAGHEFLFNDLQFLAHKPEDDFQLAVKARIDAYVAEEAAKARQKVADETMAANVTLQTVVVEALKSGAVPAQLLDEVSKIGNFLASDAIADHAIQKASIKATAIPTLKLGTMAERLGFNVTADFLRTLGFEPAAKMQSAMLYHEEAFPQICKALIAHIESVCEIA